MTFVSIMDTLRGQAPTVPIKSVRPVPPITSKPPKASTPPMKEHTAAKKPPRPQAPTPLQQPRKSTAESAKPTRSAPTKPAPAAAPKPKPKQPPTQGSSAPRKKLSFKDVMKQGRSVDKSKLEVMIHTRKQPAQPQSQSQSKRLLHNKREPQRSADGSGEPERYHPASKEGRHKDRSVKAQVTGSRHNLPSPAPSRPTSRSVSTSANSRSSLSTAERASTSAPPSKSKFHKSSAPAPAARPSAELLRKLESRKRGANQRPRSGYGHDSEEDDLSDFVEEDEDEIDFYRGGGQRRYNDDFSDSDMDATGGDVFEEEQRSAARAKREDREEEMRLEELAMRKRQRRG